MSKSVIIIGGGIIGTACAHFLAEASWDVTIIERGQFGSACSHGNCGLVCPSHVLPMAEPGAVGRALKSMFQKNSPFYIKPRFDPALWSWLWNFARHCNSEAMLSSGQAIARLLDSSMSLYRQLVENGGLDCEWEARGLLFAYRDPEAFERYAETNKLLGDVFHHAAVRYSAQELADLEPALKPGLAGGWHYQSDAHLRPDKLLTSWRRLLESRGVVIRENCELRGFDTSANRAASVETSSTALSADAFVVATGALTPLLNKHLGCRIPIQPGKGYSITMPRPARCPSLPLIFPETRVAVTPMQTGYRLGSTMEFSGYDASLNRARLDLLRDGVRDYLHEPFCEPVQEEWFGWRPMTYDSRPIIDRTPIMRNVWIAAGHNMLGLSMAPGTGRLVSELIGEKQPHIDPAPYSLARF